MQNPESITVDLETSKALKEAGWPQDESCFYHREILHKGAKRMHRTLISAEIKRHCEKNPPPNPDAVVSEELFAAPTASELWKQMPEGTEMRKKKNAVRVTIPCIVPTPHGTKSHAEERKNEQAALSAMWLYLKKNGLLPENI